MDNMEFLKRAIQLVMDYFNGNADATDKNGKITARSRQMTFSWFGAAKRFRTTKRC